MTDMPIRALMSKSPWTVTSTENIAAAWALMHQHHIRHLPVVDAGKVVGVLSERDVRVLQCLRGVDPEDIGVGELMSRQPYCVGPDTPLSEVARQMGERRLGSVVVVEDGRVAGIFTTTDALLAIGREWRGGEEAPASL